MIPFAVDLGRTVSGLNQCVLYKLLAYEPITTRMEITLKATGQRNGSETAPQLAALRGAGEVQRVAAGLGTGVLVYSRAVQD